MSANKIVLEGPLTSGWEDDYHIGDSRVGDVLLDILRSKQPGDIVTLTIEVRNSELA